jgi:hypothetical protein
MSRPTKSPRNGTRVSLGLKVTPAMKRKIDAKAKESGRTQSQVAELWLEKACMIEDMIAAGILKQEGKKS